MLIDRDSVEDKNTFAFLKLQEANAQDVERVTVFELQKNSFRKEINRIHVYFLKREHLNINGNQIKTVPDFKHLKSIAENNNLSVTGIETKIIEIRKITGIRNAEL